MSSLLLIATSVAIFIFWSGKWLVHILAITYGKFKLHKKSRLKSMLDLSTQSTNVILTTGGSSSGVHNFHKHHHHHYHSHNGANSIIPLLHESELGHHHHGTAIDRRKELTTSCSSTSISSCSNSSLKDNKTDCILNNCSGGGGSGIMSGAAIPAPSLVDSTVKRQTLGQQTDQISANSKADTIIDCDFCESEQIKIGGANSVVVNAEIDDDDDDPNCSIDQMMPTAINAVATTASELSLSLLDNKEQKVLVTSSSSEIISLPKVSILKPLMGTDPNLALNLETFFTLNYPKNAYELLFCVESKLDPAIGVCKTLMDKYKHSVDARLFIGGVKVGVNPKINNMEPGYQAAKYELIMISDAGIKMKEDTLLDMVEHMTEKVGLVHQMPFTSDREGFAATYEKIFFGTVQSRIYLATDCLGIICHTGMSCLTRKKILEELGGLRSLGCYLAEDFFLAQKITEAGWKMTISSQPALQNSGVCDLKLFQNRLVRWAKLRVAMVPFTIFLEPLSECMIVGAFASWSVSILFHWDPLVFYLIHILCWFLSDWILLSIVQNGSLPFSKFEFVVGWLFREFSGPYLFFSALWNPAIRWRTRVYKLAWGGLAHELNSSSKIKT